MAIASQHYDVLSLKASLYQGKTIQACLASTLLTDNSTPEQVFAAELLPVNGYARVPFTYGATDGTFDSSNNLFLPTVPAQFTAAGGTLSWTSAFVILGGYSTSAKTFQPSNVTTASSQIVITAHGLVNGDRLMFSPDTGSSLPGGLVNSTRYYVKVIDQNTIAIYSDAGLANLVPLTNQGSGNQYARYASGRILMVVQEAAAVNVASGQVYTYQLILEESKTGFS